MFDAVAWLRSVSDAAASIEADSEMEQARRAASLSLGCHLREIVVAFTPNHDKNAVSDEILDSELAKRGRLMTSESIIRDALLVFEGMRGVGLLEAQSADVLELTHVYRLSRRSICSSLRIGTSTFYRRYEYGVDWLSANGLAHAKAGTGKAETA